ncbi:SIMPL domain-containing protein [Succinimonas amylolytica]|uniref:SIMPL domain-containing protein n=1 Tax=Succinimonas amylolytica TaxID=83769 RepID=UPI0023A8E1F1
MKSHGRMQFWNMVLAAGVGTLLAVSPVWAGEQCAADRTLALTGAAALKMMPDQALVSAQIMVLDKEAKKARDRADAVVNAFFKELSAVGLASKDIQAGSVQVFEEYAWEKDRRVSKGFRATRAVTITVNDLARISETMDLVMKSGFNNISGIHYRVKDSRAVKQKVREMAVQDAVAKAQNITGQLNTKLGRVKTVNYGTVDYDNAESFRANKAVRMEMGAARAAGSYDDGDQYQAEEITFTDRVDITWELE